MPDRNGAVHGGPGAPYLQRRGQLGGEYDKLLFDAGLQVEAGSIVPTADDVLVVVDMQNDFVPNDGVNPKGGRFGVAEAHHVVPLIVQLIEAFLAKGARVVATRDYHPIDHVSFTTEGGHFPPHCVQGSVGAHFYPPIAAALETGLAKYGPEKVIIVHKGFHEDVDSMGAFEYSDAHLKVRLLHRTGAAKRRHDRHCQIGAAKGCILDWTGARVLKQSALMWPEVNVNAPPDVLAIGDSMTLADHLGRANNGYFCGLALDFCVLDSSLTAASQSVFKSSNIILDATRAAHVPLVGRFGSGFISSPKEVLQKMKAKGIKCIASIDITRAPSKELGQIIVAATFPRALGPMGVRPVDIRLDLDTVKGICVPRGVRHMRKRGRCTRGNTFPAFAYPMVNVQRMTEAERLGYIGTQDPTRELAVNGGFVTASHNPEEPALVEAVSMYVDQCPILMHFHPPQKFKEEFADTLVQSNCFQAITIQPLRDAGYTLFLWVGEGEVLHSKSGLEWTDWPLGAFVYLESEENVESAIYFAVKSREKHQHLREGVSSPLSPMSPTSPRFA
eukprot:TRINITY_DN570_c0_g1_i1.p1 TRINITY_DN570_c0_g1~~TRINITY_DN570_c0_g1_i1.p1  ORF type:complete len:575 (+),score=157.66 TRINITY_DN570_c0_g1_i1:51-1727(+)